MNETKFLLQLMSDHLHGQKSEYVEGIELEALYILGNKHQVNSIVFHQCKEFLPAQIITKFKTDYRVVLTAYIKRRHCINPLLEEISKQNINHIILKGDSIADYYPVPELRSMGDVDLLVSPDDRKKVEKILLDQGWTFIEETTSREWKYKKEGIEIELHDEVVRKSNSMYGKELFIDYFNNVLNSELLESHKTEFEFLLALRHLRKHFITFGVGFRHFYDLTVYCQNAELDWEYIDSRIKDFGFDSFAQNVFTLCDTWFGVNIPILRSVSSKEFIEEATDFIAKNGVFGFDNADNYRSHETNRALNSDNYKLATKKSALRLAFPNINDLQNKYTYLNGKKYLLPIAWIQRFFSGISEKKLSSATKAVKYELVPNEQIENRKILYDKWGL